MNSHEERQLEDTYGPEWAKAESERGLGFYKGCLIVFVVEALIVILGAWICWAYVG